MSSSSFTAAISAHKFSDLVKDSRLETEILDLCTQHVFYETGRTAHDRRVRRTEQWVRQRFLGCGAYGTVHLEKCIMGGGQQETLRAVKEIKKCIVAEEELDYARELETIAKFSNHNGWFESKDSVFIAMEYLAHGDLQRYLTRALPEVEARQIISQVLEGLQYMHENGFAHRDLKPSNIMVVNKGPDWFVKIADFGISKRRQQDVTTLHTPQRGTIGFAAPEVFGFASNIKYTFSVDMWSLGAVAYRILTKCNPFPTIANLTAYVYKKEEFPTALLESYQVSQTARDLIVMLLAAEPQDRPTAIMAGQHEWLSGSPSSFIEQLPASDDATLTPTPSMQFDEELVLPASNSWSSDSDTASMTDTMVRRGTVGDPNYQSPTVSERLEEETMRVPKLPVDSLLLLEDASATSTPKNGSVGELGLDEHGDSHKPRDSCSLHIISPGTSYAATDPLTAVTAKDDHSDRPKQREVAFININGVYPSDWELDEPVGADSDGELSISESAESATINNGPSEKEIRVLEVQCHWCSNVFNKLDSNPTERLDCSHVVCHACMLESFALSLISPVYMAPRCCGDAIDLEHFKRLIVSTGVNEAWNFMYEFTEKMRSDNWVCPSDHIGIPMVSANRLALWNKRVACGQCRTLKPNGKSEWDYFCLFCKERDCMGGCAQRHEDVIDSFVWKMKFLNAEQSRMVLDAYRVKHAIKDGEFKDWQPWEDVKNRVVLRPKTPPCVQPDPPPHSPTDGMPPSPGTSRDITLPSRRKVRFDNVEVIPPSNTAYDADSSSDDDDISTLSSEELRPTSGYEHRSPVHGWGPFGSWPVVTNPLPIAMPPPPQAYPPVYRPGYGTGTIAPYGSYQPASTCPACHCWARVCRCGWRMRTQNHGFNQNTIPHMPEPPRRSNGENYYFTILSQFAGYIPPGRKPGGMSPADIHVWRQFVPPQLGPPVRPVYTSHQQSEENGMRRPY
ncbi:calcium/calmodulin-dependent protein kinase [Apiospora marii]|uniref:Calcium/calmodulin-dependent protein kinase n=1 Tax=Apiospora marii TaxID=335849 RepID=A0ABR1RBY9_9PEZI